MQNICNCELLDTVRGIINYHCTSIDYSVHCEWGTQYFECTTQYYALVVSTVTLL